MTYQELREALTWQPEIMGEAPAKAARVVAGGMGGSALPAHALRFIDPAYPVSEHRDYDVPEGASGEALYVALSYSGNTEETLSFAHTAKGRGYALAAVSDGGALTEFATEAGVPHVVVPAGMQPRNALMYQLRALLALLGRGDVLEALAAVAFDAGAAEQEAQQLAAHLEGGLPLFYSARVNGFVAHAGRILMDETAKTPAFANVFPELNHNEMQSFDTTAPPGVAALARFVIIHDAADDPRVTKRMRVFTELMRERGRQVAELTLAGEGRAAKLARGWYTLHRAALAVAAARGVDPEAVPLVEEFKKRIA